MELTITRRDGSSYVLGGTKEPCLFIDTATQYMKLMTEDKLQLRVVSPLYFEFKIGDYTVLRSRTYKMNRLPTVRKDGSSYVYDLEFEGVQYDLLSVSFNLNIDTTTFELQNLQGDYLTGNVGTFLNVIVANANRVFPGEWIAGSIGTGGVQVKTLGFSEDDNCLSALSMIADEFDCEFHITELYGVKSIHMIPYQQQVQCGVLEYGALKGIASMHRENVNADNLCTRLFAYGGEGVPNRYRNDRLCLPNKGKGDSYIEHPSKVNNFGIYEKKRYFDVPLARTGVVTSLGGSVVEFVDSEMFDLNAKWSSWTGDYTEWLTLTNQEDNYENSQLYTNSVVGTWKYRLQDSPMITFVSGQLNGYSFLVQQYDTASKSFKIVPITERDITIPNEEYSVFQFAVGDRYQLSSINLPLSFVLAAENELLNVATAYYNDYSVPFVQYRVVLDEFSMAFKEPLTESLNLFIPGASIYIKDSAYMVDRWVRIQEVQRDLLYPLSYELLTVDISYRYDRRRRIARMIEKQPEINQHFTGELQVAQKELREIPPKIPRLSDKMTWIIDGVDTEIPVVSGLEPTFLETTDDLPAIGSEGVLYVNKATEEPFVWSDVAMRYYQIGYNYKQIDLIRSTKIK